MIKYKFHFYSCIFLFYSCSVSKVSPSEKTLFPSQTESKWWIINSVSKDDKGKDMHFCALISNEQLAQKNYAGCFISVWKQSDASFYFNQQYAENPINNFNPVFPIKLTIPGSDSTIAEWTWFVSKDKIKLLTGTPADKAKTTLSSILDITYHFTKQAPFPVSKISNHPNIQAITPLTTRISLHGKINAKNDGQMFFRVFTERDILLGMAKNNFVHWLDLLLNTGQKISLLYTTNSLGKTTIHAAQMWDPSGNLILRPAVNLQTMTDQKNAGKNGERDYPLNFYMQAPAFQGDLVLQPRMIQQEIVANKSSFWMGAVELVDQQTGLQKGIGNMYIFKQ